LWCVCGRLYHVQVLGVACGVWHTAAIVVETEGPLALGLGLGQSGGTPVKGEHSSASETPKVEMSGLSAGHHRRNSSTSSAFSDVSGP
jgi:hypothetical protein